MWISNKYIQNEYLVMEPNTIRLINKRSIYTFLLSQLFIIIQRYGTVDIRKKKIFPM